MIPAHGHKAVSRTGGFPLPLTISGDSRVGTGGIVIEELSSPSERGYRRFFETPQRGGLKRGGE